MRHWAAWIALGCAIYSMATASPGSAAICAFVGLFDLWLDRRFARTEEVTP